jgi:hypothetical protein
VAIIRGYEYETLSIEDDDEFRIKTLLRSEYEDLFRNPDSMIHYTD